MVLPQNFQISVNPKNAIFCSESFMDKLAQLASFLTVPVAYFHRN